MSYAKLFVVTYNLADHFLVQKRLTSTESSFQYIFYLILCNFFSVLCCSWTYPNFPLEGFLFETPPLWKFKFRLRCSFEIIIGLKDPSPSPSNLQWPSIGWAWIFSGTTLVVISVVNSLSLWTGLQSRGETGDQEKWEDMQETITFTERR